MPHTHGNTTNSTRKRVCTIGHWWPSVQLAQLSHLRQAQRLERPVVSRLLQFIKTTSIVICEPLGCSMIRTKGEAGTGNVVEAVRHVRAVQGGIRQLQSMDEDEIYVFAKEVRYINPGR
eukprot:1191209-Prorocentrum_minimum.AAC.4